jgi:hypothetical protein
MKPFVFFVFMISACCLQSCSDNVPNDIVIDNPAVDNVVTEYQTYEISCENDGKRIFGMAYVPQGVSGKMPAVIYSHGLGSSYSYGGPYARFLASHGFVCYCFDFCGGAPSSHSDGLTTDMSIFTEEKDLTAVLNTVRKWDFVDDKRIFLFGSSQGGMVSAMVAADYEEEVAGLILFYPAFCIQEFAMQDYKSVADIPETRPFLGMTVGRAYFANLFDYDTYEDIRRYKKDVLIIHGDRDGIVPLSYSERALKEYPSAELKVIEKAGHGFGGSEINEASGYMWEYLNEHI